MVLLAIRETLYKSPISGKIRPERQRFQYLLATLPADQLQRGAVHRVMEAT
jgi:hypothetical protein